MPTPMIKSFSEKSGKSEKEVEVLYAKANKIAKQEYPDVKEGDDKYYAIVTGILKKMLSIKEDAIITTSDINSYAKPITIKDLDGAIKRKKKMSESILERLDGYLM